MLRLEAGSQFPDWESNQAAAAQVLNPNHWTPEPLLVAGSRALALAFFRERTSAKRRKFVKQIERLLEEKYVQKDTRVGSERVGRLGMV